MLPYSGVGDDLEMDRKGGSRIRQGRQRALLRREYCGTSVLPATAAAAQWLLALVRVYLPTRLVPRVERDRSTLNLNICGSARYPNGDKIEVRYQRVTGPNRTQLIISTMAWLFLLLKASI